MLVQYIGGQPDDEDGQYGQRENKGGEVPGTELLQADQRGLRQIAVLVKAREHLPLHMLVGVHRRIDGQAGGCRQPGTRMFHILLAAALKGQPAGDINDAVGQPAEKQGDEGAGVVQRRQQVLVKLRVQRRANQLCLP